MPRETERRRTEPTGWTPAEARWLALGTTVHVLVTDPAVLDPVVGAVQRVLVAVDETYSRFRPDSELQRLAAQPSPSVQVSHLLARAVATALRAAHITEGAVDPTVGRAMRLIGYDRDFVELIDRPDPIAVHVESVPGWHRVRLDTVRRLLSIPRGVELDLGSTGKALAADLAAEAALEAARAGVVDVSASADADARADADTRADGNADATPHPGILVNLGGDIAVSGTAPEGGWRISLGDDARHDPGTWGEYVTLASGGLATSSTTVRRWSRGGVERHHIIDPATGLPAVGPWRTVSVVAASCVDANAAATAAIVRGADAPAWLERIGLPARLVAGDGSIVRVGGWREPEPAPATPSAVLAGPLGPIVHPA